MTLLHSCLSHDLLRMMPRSFYPRRLPKGDTLSSSPACHITFQLETPTLEFDTISSHLCLAIRSHNVHAPPATSLLLFQSLLCLLLIHITRGNHRTNRIDVSAHQSSLQSRSADLEVRRGAGYCSRPSVSKSPSPPMCTTGCASVSRSSSVPSVHTLGSPFQLLRLANSRCVLHHGLTEMQLGSTRVPFHSACKTDDSQSTPLKSPFPHHECVQVKTLVLMFLARFSQLSNLEARSMNPLRCVFFVLQRI